MLKPLIFLISTLCARGFAAKEEFFNLAEHNFCDLKCYQSAKNFKENVGCGCEEVVPREGLEIVNTSLLEFRTAILDKLNTFRNKVAAGETIMDSSANMMVLNYDVGLEYAATCLMKKDMYYGDIWRPCTRNKYDEELSPFTTRIKPKDATWDLHNLKDTMAYIDQKFDAQVPELVKEHIGTKQGDGKMQYFLPLIFSKHYKVGCARAMDPKNKKPAARLLILCFLSSVEASLSPYSPGKWLYSRGKPCTACLSQTYWTLDEPECNTKYTSLCGKLDPVPEYTWKMGRKALPDPWDPDDSPGGSSDAVDNNSTTLAIISCGLLVLCNVFKPNLNI